MQHLNDDDNSWKIETPEEADECSFCDLEAKPKFVFTPKLLSVVRRLCTDVKDEWQMLLKGHETETGIFCHGYYIPKQEVGPASVINNDDIDLDFVKKHNIIAGIHSHGSMAVHFSSTDDQCTNHSFIKHNIVTNNAGDFLAISRIELPCGLIKFQKATVTIDVPECKTIKGFDNIEKRSYTYIKPAVGSNGQWCRVCSRIPCNCKTGVIEHGHKAIDWKRGNKRQHGFMYGQDKYTEGGGLCGF
jgi:hypothetical protein